MKEKDRCKKSEFCPSGSPHGLRCPRQTTSKSGTKSIEGCFVESVQICDKQSVDQHDPTEKIAYSPLTNFLLPSIIKSGMHTTSSQLKDATEIEILKRILPSDPSQKSFVWMNDTIEVFRPCPSFILSTKERITATQESVLLIGRNFRNSTHLTCRFRPIESMRMNQSKFATYSQGIFLSKTRIRCIIPYRLLISMNNGTRNGTCSSNVEKTLQSNTGVLIPCYEGDKECDNIPTLRKKVNPCFSFKYSIDVSNNGNKFSGRDTLIYFTDAKNPSIKSEHTPLTINATSATLTIIDVGSMKNYLDKVDFQNSLRIVMQMQNEHNLRCYRSILREESERTSEKGWFKLTFMSRAHLSFNFSHVSTDIKYNDHFRVAIYVRPSRCNELKCNSKREHIIFNEQTPCSQPIYFSNRFIHHAYQKETTNMTLLALDDVIFRVEIQIIHGSYLPFADFFLRTMSLHITGPKRAKSYSDNDVLTGAEEKRKISPHISWEEKEINMEYFFAARLSQEITKRITAPHNLPPRWRDFERGRVLLGINATNIDEISKMREKPDPDSINQHFWRNPFQSVNTAKEMTDLFFETWHGIKLDRFGKYSYSMNNILLPYLPYLSNCQEFDSFIPIWALFESDQCMLPKIGEKYGDEWWRRNYPPLPHHDDVQAVGPFDFTFFHPIADICERKLLCSFEEDLSEPDVNPRWFETRTGTTLFDILRNPVNYQQYTGRIKSTPGEEDGGGENFIGMAICFVIFIILCD